MLERGSEADWFPVDSLAYDLSQNRGPSHTFAEKTGVDIPDGKYEVREGEDERQRRWKK